LESRRLCWDFLAEFKFDPAVSDDSDSAPMHARINNDVKFLSDASAEDADEMVGMSAGEYSSVARDLIGDPSAAGHPNTECRVAGTANTGGVIGRLLEHVLHFAEQGSQQRLVVDLRKCVKLLQQFLLALVQFAGDLDADLDIEIALPMSV